LFFAIERSPRRLDQTRESNVLTEQKVFRAFAAILRPVTPSICALLRRHAMPNSANTNVAATVSPYMKCMRSPSVVCEKI